MKTLLLTGAHGDIGQAIAAQFEAANYQILGPRREELNLILSDSIQSFLNHLKTPIDAFVHCAGLNEPKEMIAISPEDLQKTFQINAFAFYDITQYLLRAQLLCDHSTIVAISSIYGLISRNGRFAYTAAKYALNGMVKTLALELGPRNIRVNAVAPGFVDTKMTRQNNTEATIAHFKEVIPLKRLASTEDIAKVVYFIGSEQNTYINGQTIVVDGGYSIGGFQA